MSRPVRYTAVAVALVFLSLGVFLAFYLQSLGPRLKLRVISSLSDRFNADVQLADLRLSILPMPNVEGEGLVINLKDRAPHNPPIIKVRHFQAKAGFVTLFNWRNIVDQVALDGLELYLPQRGAGKPTLRTRENNERPLSFVINKIVSNDALLVIEPKPGKEPLEFPIESLVMHSVGPGEAMAFSARLTNAKPPGAIETTGRFGPWDRDNPRLTPVSGDYSLRNADLSVFKGIRGILSSRGKFDGVLQRIIADGTTDTPDFALSKTGSPVHLTTVFHSIIDGTNGDTTLDPVDAKFEHSEFICSGAIAHHTDKSGKAIELQAKTKYARLEDILTLVAKGPPVIKGDTEFQSKIIIPPGHEPVIDKLNLDGDFHLTSAIFSSDQASQRLRTLSNRASGINKAEERRGEGEGLKVASNMTVRFRLQKGVVSIRSLTFEVPGAEVKLAGGYNMVSSAVDMKGTFQMRATLSETQSGIKAVMLKPFNKLFEKNGAGFEVPISITGTKEHPNLGVSAFHKTFAIH